MWCARLPYGPDGAGGVLSTTAATAQQARNVFRAGCGYLTARPGPAAPAAGSFDNTSHAVQILLERSTCSSQSARVRTHNSWCATIVAAALRAQSQSGPLEHQ